MRQSNSLMSGMIFYFILSFIFVDHFGSATTLLLFMSSPRTSKSKTKVSLDYSRVKSKFMTFPHLCQFSTGPRAVLS